MLLYIYYFYRAFYFVGGDVSTADNQQLIENARNISGIREGSNRKEQVEVKLWEGINMLCLISHLKTHSMLKTL